MRSGARLGRRGVLERLALVLLATALLRGGVRAQGAAPAVRYVARLVDGTERRGVDQGPWRTIDTGPPVRGEPLLDGETPLRSLRREDLAPREPLGAYLELHGGDVLPAQVVAAGESDPTRERLPPHVLVEPEIPLEPPSWPTRSSVRVVTAALRRVVWRGRLDSPYRPGTIFFRDGRRLRFRSVRWGRGELVALLDEDVLRVPFPQIAEVHLPPPPDAWAYQEGALAILAPEGKADLVRLETASGVSLTTSTRRRELLAHGDASRSEGWYEIVQPAWCLDALALRFGEIAVWSFWRAHELPLSVLDPAASTQRATFGSSWVWRRDRSVDGTPLGSIEHEAVFGIGVHAYQALEFELPSFARSFQARYGLSRSVGSGGSVEARVLLRRGRRETLLHRSGPIIGSLDERDTGALSLAPRAAGPDDAPAPADAEASPRLVLVADPIAVNPPAGADVLDVRDHLDWREPIAVLDPVELARRLALRRDRAIPALSGWTGGAGSLTVITRLEASRTRAPLFRESLAGTGRVASRRLRLNPRETWLFASVSLPPDSTSRARVDVLVDGTLIARFDVPRRSRDDDPPPLLVDLGEHRSRTVDLELRQSAENASEGLEWRALSLLDRPPNLRPLLEDDPAVFAALVTRSGAARFDWRDTYRGPAALRIVDGAIGSPRWPGLRAPIRRDPQHGQFRYLRLACRLVGGDRLGVRLARDGAFSPGGTGDDGGFAYDLGTGPSVHPGARRVSSDAPRDWTLLTLDLARDLGDFELTGLEFASPDGEALFDSVWLARSVDDLERAQSSSASISSLASEFSRRVEDRTTQRREDYPALLDVVAPGFNVTGLLGNELRLFASHLGRPGVLRTHPASPTRPAVLRRRVLVPRRAPRLLLSVAIDLRGDWRLQVLVDGEPVLERDVRPDTTVDGWLDLDIDLAEHAGRSVELEIVHHASGWAWEFGYWWRVAVEGS